MRVIRSVPAVATALVVAFAVTSAFAQSHRSGTAARPGGGPATSGGPYPNAGQLLSGPFTPPVPTVFGLQHDWFQNYLWLGTENSVGGVGRPDLFMVETSLYSVLTSLVTDELKAAGHPTPQIDGPVNEITMLGDGKLLCADFNGDLTRFDDTLFLITPSNPPVLDGVWYLDDLGCPGSCVANTNTNQPKDRIDFVAGLAARHTLEITSSNQAEQQIFVGQFLAAGVIREISLTAGTPGTWATRRVYASPTGDTVDGIDWDPDLQSFWMTSTSTGLIYEVALDRSRNQFRVIQSFPTQALGGTIAVTARRGSQLPHTLFEGEGFSFTGSYREIDSGHLGRGTPVISDAAGPSPVLVGALFHPDCAGLPFRVLVSLGTGTIRVGDRFVRHALDGLFLYSLTSPAFVGQVTTSGAAVLQLPGVIPPNLGPFYFTLIVYGDPGEDSFGIKRITTMTPHVTQ